MTFQGVNLPACLPLCKWKPREWAPSACIPSFTKQHTITSSTWNEFAIVFTNYRSHKRVPLNCVNFPRGLLYQSSHPTTIHQQLQQQLHLQHDHVSLLTGCGYNLLCVVPFCGVFVILNSSPIVCRFVYSAIRRPPHRSCLPSPTHHRWRRRRRRKWIFNDFWFGDKTKQTVLPLVPKSATQCSFMSTCIPEQEK